MLKVQKKYLSLFAIIFTLTACDAPKNSPTKSAETSTQTPTTPAPLSTTAISTPNPTVKTTADGKIQLNWQAIDSGVTAIPPEQFKYPFSLDSQPVKNYMTAYHVDAKTAQHNLTIGMATNEALSKILDQINTNYISHELTAGKGSKLIIHTTANVLPTTHDYVIEDPFAKGLVLPIQIAADGKK